MARVLVTGSSGQLGQELQRRIASLSDEFIFLNSKALNVSDERAVNQKIDELRPNILINCAAYTAVDKAEDERGTAFAVNAEALKHLVKACAYRKIFLVHFSTDYVFNGQKSSPYIETDATDPQNVYGESKRRGEMHILSGGLPSVIIRTSWLYSRFGNNFVKTILRLSRERPELRIVYDQIGSPTFAGDLATFVLDNLHQFAKIQSPEIFHFANEGAISWFDFALAIKKISKTPARLLAIASREFPTKARRPAYSVLAKERVRAYFGVEIPDWMSSLETALPEME